MPDKELCLTLQQRRAAERVSAIVASERVDERRIDPLGVEYLEQLTNTGEG